MNLLLGFFLWIYYDSFGASRNVKPYAINSWCKHFCYQSNFAVGRQSLSIFWQIYPRVCLLISSLFFRKILKISASPDSKNFASNKCYLHKWNLNFHVSYVIVAQWRSQGGGWLLGKFARTKNSFGIFEI